MGRIISVREQLAFEWAEDLGVVITANDNMMQSYIDTKIEEHKGENESNPKSKEKNSKGNGECYSEISEKTPYTDCTGTCSLPKKSAFD